MPEFRSSYPARAAADEGQTILLPSPIGRKESAMVRLPGGDGFAYRTQPLTRQEPHGETTLHSPQ